MLLWVVQNNLFNERGYTHFIEALQHAGLDYVVVKPVPFTDRFVAPDFDSMKEDLDTAPEPFIDTSKPIMISGSITLSKIALKRGWKPGTFLNNNFDYGIWREGFGPENLLNGDGTVCKLRDAVVTGDVFTRPTKDTKAFTGMVMSQEDFAKWQATFIDVDKDEITPVHQDTEIFVARPKAIYSEWRLFVIDKKVVTGSKYKQGRDVVQTNVIDKHILEFGQRMAEKWQPADAFVIDVADTAEGPKVIEINNINSAGFYEADVHKIIMGLETWYEGILRR